MFSIPCSHSHVKLRVSFSFIVLLVFFFLPLLHLSHIFKVPYQENDLLKDGIFQSVINNSVRVFGSSAPTTTPMHK